MVRGLDTFRKYFRGFVVEVFTDLNLWIGIRKVIEQINANAAA